MRIDGETKSASTLLRPAVFATNSLQIFRLHLSCKSNPSLTGRRAVVASFNILRPARINNDLAGCHRVRERRVFGAISFRDHAKERSGRHF